MTPRRFKVGDHVSWNSEAGRVTRHITRWGYIRERVQGLHGARGPGGAAVRDHERHHRSHRHAQGLGAHEASHVRTGTMCRSRPMHGGSASFPSVAVPRTSHAPEMQASDRTHATIHARHTPGTECS